MNSEAVSKALKSRTFRRAMYCGTALPLVAFAVAANANPITEQFDSDITVTADSASGTPIAVELYSSGGSIDASVTDVTGTTVGGDRDYVIGMETDLTGSITGTFSTITATGAGEILGLGATTIDGDITLDVGTLDVDGAASAGIAAISTNGDIGITADTVISRGTGEDSQQEFYEAVLGNSQNGSVNIAVGTSETYGTYGSAIVGLAGSNVAITADGATNHGAGAVTVYAIAAGDVSADVGTITSTADDGQGAYLKSNGGSVSLSADTITVGDFAQGARIVAADDVKVDVGTITGGQGVRVDPTAGDVTIAIDSVETYTSAVNASTTSGGGLTIDVGDATSHLADTATIIASATGGGTLAVAADSVTGAGVDHAAIEATTDSGDISIVAGDVSTSGDGAMGVLAQSTDGNIDVSVDTVATTGLGLGAIYSADGVTAISTNGTATVTVGSGTTEGKYSSVAAAVGGAGAHVTVGDVSAAGLQGAVVFSKSSGGNATVDAGTVTLRGDQQAGINALADVGVATVTIDSVVDEGTSTKGIFARGGSGASVTAGSIEADVYGAWANVTGTGNASVVTTGNTSVGAGYGLRGTGTNVTISTAADTVTQASTNAIWGEATESVTIGNQGTARTTGGMGSAIYAQSGGSVSITSAHAEAVGPGVDPGVGQDGLRVPQGGIVAFADGAIDIDADTVTVAGEFRYAVYGEGAGGVTINANDVELASADTVAVAGKSDAGDVSITTGTVTTTGASGVGVFGHTGSGDIAIDAGITRVENAGMQGQFTGDAVVATSDTGNISITSQDAFSAALYGSAIVGISAGDVALVSGNAETTGDGGVAVYGLSNSGNVSLAAETVSANSTAQGVFLKAAGTVTAEVGSVTAGYGLYAVGTGNGAISLDVGTAQASNNLGSAIKVTAAGPVSIAADAVAVTGAGADPGAGPDGLRKDQGGIVVQGGGEAISIDAGSVTVEGEHRYGITARGNGAITINADTVDLASADAVAVVARGGAGDVSITTGTVTTTGASGVGVFGNSTTGNITIDAGTTRVENAGMQGQFTGDAVVGISGSGSVSITSDNAFSAALYGSAVVGISDGDVSIVSNVAETTGDGGAAVFGRSNFGALTMDVGSVTISGDNAGAVGARANNGVANVTIGDITATGLTSLGLTATGQIVNVTVNGDVSTTGRGISATGFVESNVTVNGSITTTESNASGVVTTSAHGVVTIAEGASVNGGAAGVAMLGQAQGGFSELYNSGTVHGTAGVAVRGLQADPNFVPADYYIQNNGTLSSDTGVAVLTGAGDDVLELTENSVIDGIADLGAGYDHLVLDFNDNAAADAIGQVVSTVNVEMLSVERGSWRAEGVASDYDEVEIEEGATLTVAQDANGDSSIGTGYVDLGGTLNLDFAHDTDVTGVLIEGAGSLHLVGGATVLVEDASGLQFTGGTFVENGTLLLTDVYGGAVTTSGDGTFELGDGGTTGDFTGDLVNDGTFVFSRSDDYSLSGAFSGTGLLVKNGDGTLSFGGTYDFSGTTTINAGAIALTGQLDANSELDLSGDGSFDLSQVSGGTQEVAELSGTGGNLELGTTTLTINQQTNTVFSGTISGDGTVNKEGTGDLKLEGDSTFTGSANVNGGTLSVNGSYAGGTFTVNDGGLLGGNGTVGDTTIQGGALGAGNSIGHLTVAGDLTFTSASTLVVEVDPAGNADLIEVTGAATLGGATVNVLAGAGTYAPVTDYTILTADGGISGTFGTVTTNLAYLVPLLSYTVDTVSLRLSRNDVDFSGYAANPNQSAIGNLIEDLGFGSTLYDSTLLLARADVADDFETLTGGVYPSFVGAMVETADMLRRQTMDAPRSGSGAYGWATGLLGNVKGTAGTGIAGYKADNTGVAGGLGYAMAGFDISGGVGYLSQDPSGSQVSDSKVTFATLQAAYDSPIGFKVRGGVQLGWFDAKSSRSTSLGTISNSLSGALKGDYTQYYGEVAFAVPSVAVSIEPFAGVSHVSLKVDSFTETGGATALTVNGMDRDVTFGDLGLRISAPLPGGVTPYGSASYRMAWGDRASLAGVAFAGNTTSGLVTGLPIAKTAAEVEAGLRYTAGKIELGLGYSGSFSKTFDSNTAKLTATLKF
ncbi:hypothetical protein GRI89_05260 [Altererythrobacter salegens]|uniref:Autotransporter domain-containing protein n=1 Tax=Croceibacterium salegens TaxID=1737568 RepID=A0A6I4SSM9_9SPHN|nr:autotransporter outer membrane beta-barrel domain-containing protein [Croceibacterium salegens]MXO58944.1 hypothetical protein [Croceibacterium salegens]